jgi:hypothetical protein
MRKGDARGRTLIMVSNMRHAGGTVARLLVTMP